MNNDDTAEFISNLHIAYANMMRRPSRRWPKQSPVFLCLLPAQML